MAGKLKNSFKKIYGRIKRGVIVTFGNNKKEPARESQEHKKEEEELILPKKESLPGTEGYRPPRKESLPGTEGYRPPRKESLVKESGYTNSDEKVESIWALNEDDLDLLDLYRAGLRVGETDSNIGEQNPTPKKIKLN